MTKSGIKFINDTISPLINYSFMRYWGDLSQDFWVGESYETGGSLEDGSIVSTLLITGTTTKEWTDLLTERDIIKDALNGKKAMIETGGIAVYYESGQIIPSDDDKIKRYEMKFTIREWKKGNIR